MYTLAVCRDFAATHALIGGDWGAENQPHSHAYRLELRLESATLDQHGYVIDIVAVEAALDALLERFADSYLNEQPEFAGLNPSIEHFARILAEDLAAALPAGELLAFSVQLWEGAQAWARYRLEV